MPHKLVITAPCLLHMRTASQISSRHQNTDTYFCNLRNGAVAPTHDVLQMLLLEIKQGDRVAIISPKGDLDDYLQDFTIDQ